MAGTALPEGTRVVALAEDYARRASAVRAVRAHGYSPATRAGALSPPTNTLSDRREYDRRRLAEALKETNGNVASAAALVGLSRQRAYRLLGDRSAGNFTEQPESVAKEDCA